MGFEVHGDQDATTRNENTATTNMIARSHTYSVGTVIFYLNMEYLWYVKYGGAKGIGRLQKQTSKLRSMRGVYLDKSAE